MRKTWIIAVAAAAVALAGCNREMDSPVAAPSDGLFRAAIEAPTRVALSDEGAFSWQAGDAVAVLTNDGIKPFALVEGAGSKVAAFDGSLGAATSATVAVYPASIAKDDNTVTLPAEYAWAEGQSNAAMYCNPVSLTGVNSFKHLGGILKIAYAEIPANADALVLTASAQITGDFTITDGVIAAGAGESQVKVTFAAGSNPAAFYIPVPTGEFNFSVELQAAGSPIADTQKGTSSPIKIDRRSLVLMDPIAAPEPMTFTITTAEEFVQFLSEAPTYRAQDTAVLGNDIDLTGIAITPAESFAGTFDGAGKSLKNISLSNAIFADLSGTVKDLKIENGALNFNSTYPDMTGFAFIASFSTGTVKDCDVNGDIKINSPGKDDEGTKARIYVAGLVGECTTGLVEGCKFSGSIDVELTELSRSISSIGGVVSRAGKKGQTGKVIVKDCVNEASIKFKFSGASGGMQKFGIGGVVGQTPSNSGVKGDDNFDCGIIENITNYGNIEWEYPAGGSGSYPVLGGAVGAVEGELHGAKNYGNLKYTGSLTTAVTDASIGGVAGYVTGDASDCHNYGTITLDAAFAGGTALAQNGGNTDWSTFGGVFGNVGQFIKTSTLSTKPSRVENISNNAELILTPKMINSGGPRMCIAGVIGASTANLKDVVNNMPITIQTQTKSAYVSGCVGYLAGNLENGVNNASVVVDGLKDEVPATNTNYEQFWFGGVVGYIIKGGALVGCENHGDLTLQNVFTTPTALSYMGGVNGAYSGGFSMSDCFNEGAILDKADNPICLGGVSGSYNGHMIRCYNAGTVTYESTYVSTEAGKEPEVGGLAGYINADMTGCESAGDVTAAAGFAGGIAGGCGQDTNGLIWKATDVNCNVTSAGSASAVLARFRDSGTTVLTLGAEGEPIRVTDALDALPICAELKGNAIAEVNVIRGKIEVAPKADKTAIYSGETVQFSISGSAKDVLWRWEHGTQISEKVGNSFSAAVDLDYTLISDNTPVTVTVRVMANVNGDIKNWDIPLTVKPYAIFDKDFETTSTYQGFYGMAPVFSPDGKAVYVVTSQGKGSAYAYSTETFERLWSFQLDGRNQNSCAVNPVTGDLYVPTSNTAKLYALTPAGAQKWVCTLPDNVNQRAIPAIIKDGSLVFISAAKHLVAVNTETGAIVWDKDLAVNVNALTVNGSELIVGVGAAAKGIRFVNTADGEEIASIDLPATAPNEASNPGIGAMTAFAVAADGKTAYVGGGGSNDKNNGMVYMIDIDAHQMLKYFWIDSPYGGGGNSSYEPVISPVNGDVFFGNKNSSVYCFDKDLNAVKWTYAHLENDRNAFNYSHPCVDADGNFMISAGQSKPCTYIFSPNGDILKQYVYATDNDSTRSMAGNNYLNGFLYTLGYGAKGNNGYFIVKYVGGSNPTGSWVRSGGDLCGSCCIK